MTQHEFVVVYVALPLAIAVGWLLWRGRYFLRNLLIYAIVVVALLAAIRSGQFVWVTWENWTRPSAQELTYPVCNDPASWSRAVRTDSCWT